MHDVVFEGLRFIDLNMTNILFLFAVGFIGGLVSGFIGSGGAFVLTPGMMSLGVPGTVAVASNMCHKFPKALVGAIKRFRYGQVDVKLGLILGVSAEVGVQVGISVQKWILDTWGQAGSDLYVSLSFLVILVLVGGYVLKDALKTKRSDGAEQMTSLAKRIQAIEIWPMITFKRSGIRVSLWVTVPIGFLTGMLAATIAVGGFVGVPGMIYSPRPVQHHGLGQRAGHRLRHGPGRNPHLGLLRHGRHPPDPHSSSPAPSSASSSAPSAPPMSRNT